MSAYLHRTIPRYCLAAVLSVICSPIVEADCIDMLKDGGLPQEAATPLGNEINYRYELEKNEYFVLWRESDGAELTFGPFGLPISCRPESLAHENNELLILEGGCGTFCWYYRVISLRDSGRSSMRESETVERPLAFDPERSLLAYYHSQDVIAIRNLLTSYEQQVRTAHQCEMYSGLCFDSVRINERTLEYLWRYSAERKELFQAPLDEGLMSDR